MKLLDMELEGVGNGKMMGMRSVTPTHKRSNSFPDKKTLDEAHSDGSLEKSNLINLKKFVKSKKNDSLKMEGHNSLKQEILQLEKRLQDQFECRHALEKALGHKFSSHDDINSNEISVPKISPSQPATVLIKEIAVLEHEVMHLEQYLLSLYRKAFDGHISSISPPKKEEKLKPPLSALKKEDSLAKSVCLSIGNLWKESNGILGEDTNFLDSSVRRCQSSLSHRSSFPTRTSPPIDESSADDLRAYHSQPLFMMEDCSSNMNGLAEHLGTQVSDHLPLTSPNRLSEDMIKCLSAIYCKLSEPPLANHGLSSPNSSFSSIGGFSPQYHQCDMWSPNTGLRNEPSFDVRLVNPFHVEGLKEFSGPYNTMVEVPWIDRDNQKLCDTEHLLQNFRMLISQLEVINPQKLNHEEKLAFWINIHNAVLMHAYLAYGIPQNSVKKGFLLLKAAYNIGGHTISADMIQNSILGCRLSRPGQWIRLLFSTKTKFKNGDDRQAYVIDRPEPLLHFALASGNHSDPAVRVYTSKRVFQELEAAKTEYIRATFGVKKEQKILLPKIVELYAKDSGLCPVGLTEMLEKTLPETLRKSVKKCQLGRKSGNKSIIEWSPHNFSFRYLICKELVT